MLCDRLLTLVLRVCAANGLSNSIDSGFTSSCVAISHAPIYANANANVSVSAHAHDGGSQCAESPGASRWPEISVLCLSMSRTQPALR